jgi:hypothetical protein
MSSAASSLILLSRSAARIGSMPSICTTMSGFSSAASVAAFDTAVGVSPSPFLAATGGSAFSIGTGSALAARGGSAGRAAR